MEKCRLCDVNMFESYEGIRMSHITNGHKCKDRQIAKLTSQLADLKALESRTGQLLGSCLIQRDRLIGELDALKAKENQK